MEVCSKTIETTYFEEDILVLRKAVEKDCGIAFVANGSFLPIAAKQLQGHETAHLVPFKSPTCYEKEYILPHHGSIRGMLIPQGVTVIVGGGFHGKSTLLNALKIGALNREMGTGCDFVVSSTNTLSIRSEDARYVGGVDISPFIADLPPAAGVLPTLFCTDCASGSTSMAANIIEAIEVGAEVFLLDEDTCASNFLIRDSRMRALVAHEPITPFIYRVNGLYKQLGISTVIVIGGAGDWLDVQDHTIMMDNYLVSDVTAKALSISKVSQMHSFKYLFIKR